MFCAAAAALPDGVVYQPVTDIDGKATVVISGGGCACVTLQYEVTAARCGFSGPIAGEGFSFCVKSVDFNGNGVVNFFDVFKFLPLLNAGSGYCGDFNCDGKVNFFDTFVLLPTLGTTVICPAIVIPPTGTCSITCD